MKIIAKEIISHEFQFTP